MAMHHRALVIVEAGELIVSMPVVGSIKMPIHVMLPIIVTMLATTMTMIVGIPVTNNILTVKTNVMLPMIVMTPATTMTMIAGMLVTINFLNVQTIESVPVNGLTAEWLICGCIRTRSRIRQEW